MIKLISWNVNGLRAAYKKGFEEFFKDIDADIFCVQETKLQEGQIDFKPDGYYNYWNSAVKKGYSGTAAFTKIKPENVTYGMQIEEHDNEGRIICMDLGKFYMVDVYTPNSKRDLLRLSYRMQWEDDFRAYLMNLNKDKPVIVCGDLNVAHEEIDLKNPKTNRRNAGFTDEEREKMTTLLSSGFTDSFRYLYPELTGAYSWWSYMGNARYNNTGWRIDYFLVSKDIEGRIKAADIYPNVFGSDHCPVGLSIDL
ncbi:MAG: exodeoxyribonuclease III [Clostridiales bacterium]|jgi:exodeoxyribonuclease-3|nr:exodeoxyribonuclease III [Clostridiales bacterium]